MKANNLYLAIFTCLLISVTSCRNSTEKKSEKLEDAENDLLKAAADLNKARIDSANGCKLYKEEAESKMRANEHKITELRQKIKEDNSKERAKDEKELDELSTKNAKLQADLKVCKVSMDKWESFKVNFNREIEAISVGIAVVAANNRKKHENK